MAPRLSPPQQLDPLPPQPASPTSPESANLTTWFLSAKRSLSSISLCTRAHELVDAARSALQEASIISSRCVFLRAALQDQLKIAGQVNRMMHSTQEAARAEFEKTLTDLDDADIRLNDTLEQLRNSIVDPAFGATHDNTGRQGEVEGEGVWGAGEADGHAEGADASPAEYNCTPTARVRTLHDFVEDEGIENLKSRLRHSIDYVQESHDALHASITTFDASLVSLSTALSQLPDPTPHTEPLHPPLHALEQHTEAMASLLESLTQHYDRCSLALKSDAGGTPPADLYHVLSRDAAMVPDVTAELTHHLASMESISSRTISATIHQLRTLEHDTLHVFAAFDTFLVRQLQPGMDVLRDFEVRQLQLRGEMDARQEELWQLAEFYEGFIGAYDAMVVEVARRKGVEVGMEKVVREAVEKLQRIYDEEEQARAHFKSQHGLWLPVDLWPGFNDAPTRWALTRDAQGGRPLPQLDKRVIERALRRG